MQPKMALREISKAFGLSFYEVERIVGFVKEISTLKVTLKDLYEENEDFRMIIQEDRKKEKIFEIASKLEGVTLNKSIHAAGVVLVRNEDIDYIDYNLEDLNIKTTQHDMHDVEFLGLIKFDILGIDSLSVIQSSIEELNINLNLISLENEKTFEEIRKGSTIGLFQVSYVNSEIMKLTKVNTIENLAEIIGLNRPGSMDYINTYIERKNGGSYEIEFPHEKVKDIVKNTMGIFIWQEQIMHLSIVTANYTGAESDHLRKIIGKKKFDLMKNEREKYILKASEIVGED